MPAQCLAEEMVPKRRVATGAGTSEEANNRLLRAKKTKNTPFSKQYGSENRSVHNHAVCL